jgi:hypothetical protein
MRKLILAIAFICFSSCVFSFDQANTYYVKEGATGNNSGSDWNNAYNELPVNLIRNATYYVSDGNYGPHLFNTRESGTQFITIKKATIADHGTSSGWDDNYGDGQATFNNLNFQTNYWIMDGQKRDGLTNGYGFKVIPIITRETPEVFNIETKAIVAQDSNFVTLKYIDVQHRGTGFESTDDGIYAPFAKNLLVQYCYIHDFSSNGMSIGATENVLIENTLFARSGGPSESVHSQGIQVFGEGTKNLTIRNCVFEDIFGTASIAVAWGTNGLYIYNNIFRQTDSYSGNGTSPGQIVEITSGSYAGELSNAYIYNNDFINIQKGLTSGIWFYKQKNGTNYVYNNIWFNSAKAIVKSEEGTIYNNYNCYSNTTLDPSFMLNDKDVWTPENPFANDENYKLKSNSPAIDKGTSFGNEYAFDKDGTPRPQGTAWDIGAYEYIEQTQPTICETYPQEHYNPTEIQTEIKKWTRGEQTLKELIRKIKLYKYCTQ